VSDAQSALKSKSEPDISTERRQTEESQYYEEQEEYLWLRDS